MSEKTPAPSVLKARRRRKPIFIDEPIQWHLRTTQHDHCPWCGRQVLATRGPRRRLCTKVSCESDYEIYISPGEWLEAKLNGNPEVHSSPSRPRYSPLDGDLYDLKEAQIRSNVGRGVLGIQNTLGLGVMSIFWHRVGHLPELRDGMRACEGGSEFHKWLKNLRHLKIWVPDDPLCAMEVIARAASGEPMFCIM